MRIVGIAAKVSNAEIDKIGRLWGEFYQSNILEKLGSNVVSDEVISVYTDYEGDHNAPYTLLIGYEVLDPYNCPDNLAERTIDGFFEKFIVKGELPKSVIEQWSKIWADTSKKRAYIADFDRYKNDGSVEINVEYIS